MDINQRIKIIRDDFKLNQEDFGGQIGLKRGAVSWMEQSGHNIVSQNKKMICSVFNISEHWLETGEGDMYVKNEDSLFAAFAERYNLSPTEQEVARYCLQLTSAQRAEILNHIRNIADKIQPKPEVAPNHIDQELADYRKELEAEQRAQLVYEDSDKKKNGTK